MTTHHTTSQFGRGYRAALKDIMDAYERNGLSEGILDWIENNADSSARDTAGRAKAARTALAEVGDDSYADGYKVGYAAGRRDERAETEGSLDKMREQGYRAYIDMGDAE